MMATGVQKEYSTQFASALERLQRLKHQLNYVKPAQHRIT